MNMTELVLEQCEILHRESIYKKAMYAATCSIMAQTKGVHLRLEEISLVARILANAAMWGSCKSAYLDIRIADHESSVYMACKLQIA